MKEIRTSQGLGVRKMARLMGTSTRVIQDFEKGIYNPTIAFINRYAKTLGVRVEIYTWINTV